MIAGTVYTGQPIPNSPLSVTKTFLWNTATNQVDYFLPANFLETEPYFISPDGKILEFGGFTSPITTQTLIWDTTNTVEENKGFQDCATWLVDHGYLTGADVQGRHSFAIYGMSDDGQTVVGNFYNSSNVLHSFYARRRQTGVVPPIGINP
jgi:hypothetical protein